MRAGSAAVDRMHTSLWFRGTTRSERNAHRSARRPIGNDEAAGAFARPTLVVSTQRDVATERSGMQDEITEAVRDSEFPVRLIQVETIDGLYAPIGLRTPKGRGPFPLVLFAYGNGGGGIAVVRDFTQNRSWTQEQFLAGGYAVAWMRYRAEVDYAYDRIGKLIEDRRQNRQLLNRGPLEYEDVISIAEYLMTLPAIAPERVGYMGMSHGGEMAFKIAAEYSGVRAMIASEPAAHEFLRLRPDATAGINPATGLLDVERMLMREPAKVRGRITDAVQREAVKDSIGFFDACLKTGA